MFATQYSNPGRALHTCIPVYLCSYSYKSNPQNYNCSPLNCSPKPNLFGFVSVIPAQAGIQTFDSFFNRVIIYLFNLCVLGVLGACPREGGGQRIFLRNEPKPMIFHTENKGRINMKWKLQNEPNAAWPKLPASGHLPRPQAVLNFDFYSLIFAFSSIPLCPRSSLWQNLKMTKRTQFKNR
jgi:hypothetical protein